MENVIFLSKNSTYQYKFQFKYVPLRQWLLLQNSLKQKLTTLNKISCHKNPKLFWFGVVLLFIAWPEICCYAQNTVANGPVNWSISAQEKSGGAYNLEFIAQMKEGWHIYPQNAEVEAFCTNFYMDAANKVQYLSVVEEEGNLKRSYQSDGQLVSYYEDKVKFVMGVLPEKSSVLNGQIKYTSCSGSSCSMPCYLTFEFKFEH